MNKARTPEEMRAASAIDPLNDLHLIRLAQKLEDDGQPSLEAWRQAITVNPRRDLSLTQAAIAAELSGSTPEAEHLLLQAEQYNHLWLPRWSLANFYARHNQASQTFRWAREAMLRSYADPSALFLLCRNSGASNADLLQSIIPPTPAARGAFVYFLVRQKEPDSLELAAAAYLKSAQISGTRPIEKVETVAAAITALIAADQPDPAWRLWTLLDSAHLLPYAAGTAAQPLVNPDLRPPLRPPAFDWQIPAVAGVETLRGVPDNGIKFTFSGTQPEFAELLAQNLYLRAANEWTLAFEYETRGFSQPKAGLRWKLGGADAVQDLVLTEDWQPASITWNVPPASGLRRLSLEIVRVNGQPRVEGELRLRALQFRAGGAK
ncbi:hypothetical protein [Paludibaculum fermentans]|uniref:hypothetical protein n=1 Tax=Paludibaculum fermentans TaxID=1473598 RepID=UPI003EBC8BF9